MQYYPVIYTRTRCCDYFAGFHVRPDFIVPAEVLPYIRTATTDMDAYEHTKKHLIISTDKMILFGIVGFIQDIGGTTVELYARDEKNRAIFGFYGFAAKRENDFNTSKIPDIQDCDIIRAYEKYVMPYWNCLDQDTKKAEPISLEEKEIAVSPIPEEFLWNETVHVHSETDNPDRLYTTLLLDALNGTVLSYCSCVNDFKALKNINLEIEPNKITAFIGPSGCGKSTLLKSINRMNDLVEGCRIDGEILLDGQNIFKGMDVNVLRKRVGMVFQKPNPFPMSIYDNIAYGPRTHGIRSKAKLDDIVEKSLRNAAIWDECKECTWHVRWTAAETLHCTCTCSRTGSTSDG